MQKLRYVTIALMIVLLATVSMTGWSQSTSYFSSRELDDLLGPIALYPDPLLAQILPAATYPDQLDRAAELVDLNGGYDIIDSQDWDISVKAVAHYPSVIKMMVDRQDWTDDIAQAYMDQPDDVMNSVQRLRSRARLLGNLYSTREQRVYVEDGFVRVVPADGQYIYVPRYNPDVVYVERRHSDEGLNNVISFGLGLLIGSWLNRDVDWHHHHVYYHGWSGGGWISHSRPYVHVNNIYVNNRYRDVVIGRSHRDGWDRDRRDDRDRDRRGGFDNRRPDPRDRDRGPIFGGNRPGRYDRPDYRDPRPRDDRRSVPPIIAPRPGNGQDRPNWGDRRDNRPSPNQGRDDSNSRWNRPGRDNNSNPGWGRGNRDNNWRNDPSSRGGRSGIDNRSGRPSGGVFDRGNSGNRRQDTVNRQDRGDRQDRSNRDQGRVKGNSHRNDRSDRNDRGDSRNDDRHGRND